MQPEPSIVVIDTETTGFSPRNGGRVIEIGAVMIAGTRVVDEFATLIDAGAPISRRAWMVHGITRQMLRGQPSPAHAWSAFARFVGELPVAAHNAPFDRPFVLNELARICIPFPNPWICTLSLSRRRLPGLPSHRLDAVYTHLFGPIPPSARRHRALDDARLAAEILMRLM